MRGKGGRISVSWIPGAQGPTQWSKRRRLPSQLFVVAHRWCALGGGGGGRFRFMGGRMLLAYLLAAPHLAG